MLCKSWSQLLVFLTVQLAVVALYLHASPNGQKMATNLQTRLLGKPWPDYGDYTCQEYVGAELPGKISVLLTADPGDFSGTPEAHYLLGNLKHVKAKARNETTCGGVYFGSLMGQSVLVVTTGIGPTAAALCTQELLTACGKHMKEIVYFGTSGWSPLLGGALNPPEQCTTANTQAKPTRLGDVCISPFSVNWACKKASWEGQSSGAPDLCSLPREVSGPNMTDLYGECVFVRDMEASDLALTAELAAAAQASHSNFPARSDTISAYEQDYWSSMSQGTGLNFTRHITERGPRVWNYTQCMEVDSQFFYSGVPWEAVARSYAAQALNMAALPSGSSSQYNPRTRRLERVDWANKLMASGAESSGPRALLQDEGVQQLEAVLLGAPKTAMDMIAVAAMEAVGVNEAMLKYHRLHSTKRHIPYTHVRTMSNWLYQPVVKLPDGRWDTYRAVPERFSLGYGYAIATGSATILNMFQQRCMAAAAVAADKSLCTFTVPYSS